MEPVDTQEVFKQKALDVIQEKSGLMITGGGTLGIALVGSLERLTELGFSLSRIKTVKGSSVGSFIATAIACGADVEYMKDKIGNMQLSSFKDSDTIFCSLWQLVKKFGMNKKDGIDNFAGEILEDLTGDSNITFAELYHRTRVHLIITYLSINLEQTIYADYLTEPNSLVRETIVKSSAIPVFYEGHISKKSIGLKRLFSKRDKVLAVDGGTLDNYSFNYIRDFVKESKMLGLKLVPEGREKDSTNVGEEQSLNIEPGYPKNVVDYFTRLIYLMRDQAMRLHVRERDWMSSVKIYIGKYSSTDFDLDRSEKEWLFNQGRLGAEKYIDELANLIIEGKYQH